MLYSFPFIALLILVPMFLAASPGSLFEQLKSPKMEEDNSFDQPEL